MLGPKVLIEKIYTTFDVAQKSYMPTWESFRNCATEILSSSSSIRWRNNRIQLFAYVHQGQGIKDKASRAKHQGQGIKGKASRARASLTNTLHITVGQRELGVSGFGHIGTCDLFEKHGIFNLVTKPNGNLNIYCKLLQETHITIIFTQIKRYKKVFQAHM